MRDATALTSPTAASSRKEQGEETRSPVGVSVKQEAQRAANKMLEQLMKSAGRKPPSSPSPSPSSTTSSRPASSMQTPEVTKPQEEEEEEEEELPPGWKKRMSR